jgi:outer membrane protein, heavy metal efflux system
MRATGLGWIPEPVLSGASRNELDGRIRTLGIGVRVPLWDFSRAATERERQRVRSLEERERALRQELQAQVRIHHNHLRLDRRTLALFQEGLLGEADASMEIAEAAYREGEISFLEYLDSRRTYRLIQIEYRQALYDWNVERAALEQAVGGGTL